MLSWRSGEPYLVNIEFRTDGDTVVLWQISRELLSRGLREPAGIGDVLISPDLDGMLRLTVQSLDGRASFVLEWAPVRDFLARTYRQVSERDEWGDIRNCDFRRLLDGSQLD